ncbi:hypothetical protein D3C71_2156010 [compost metagenome]
MDRCGEQPFFDGCLHVDRLRLPGRADALSVAMCELAFRVDGYLRIPEGQLLLHAGGLEGRADGASASALELARV